MSVLWWERGASGDDDYAMTESHDISAVEARLKDATETCQKISDVRYRSQRETQFMKDIAPIVIHALIDGVEPAFVMAILEFNAKTIETALQ